MLKNSGELIFGSLHNFHRFGGQKIASHRFEAIRANRLNIMNIYIYIYIYIFFFFFPRIESRESPRFALRIAGQAGQRKNWNRKADP